MFQRKPFEYQGVGENNIFLNLKYFVEIILFYFFGLCYKH